LVRNLEVSEIVGQIMLARDALDAWPAAALNRPLTNIVMMGMGEPLYNFENVKKALSITIDDEGLAMSRRRVTLSTSGIVPEIRRCGHEIGCMLAISLHAVHDELRDELVPINRKYKIAELMDACRDYSTLSNARRITFEYVMLKGVNDSLAEARELVRLMADIPSKVNLIPFNQWPGAIYECSSNNVIDRFASLLRDAGCVATVRSPRGQDIMAACGQLKSASVRQRRSVEAE
jgi:23S rRNA (adenine2503-C2)-methyltransferase